MVLDLAMPGPERLAGEGVLVGAIPIISSRWNGASRVDFPGIRRVDHQNATDIYEVLKYVTGNYERELENLGNAKFFGYISSMWRRIHYTADAVFGSSHLHFVLRARTFEEEVKSNLQILALLYVFPLASIDLYVPDVKWYIRHHYRFYSMLQNSGYVRVDPIDPAEWSSWQNVKGGYSYVTLRSDTGIVQKLNSLSERLVEAEAAAEAAAEAEAEAEGVKSGEQVYSNINISSPSSSHSSFPAASPLPAPPTPLFHVRLGSINLAPIWDPVTIFMCPGTNAVFADAFSLYELLKDHLDEEGVRGVISLCSSHCKLSEVHGCISDYPRNRCQCNGDIRVRRECELKVKEGEGEGEGGAEKTGESGRLRWRRQLPYAAIVAPTVTLQTDTIELLRHVMDIGVDGPDTEDGNKRDNNIDANERGGNFDCCINNSIFCNADSDGRRDNDNGENECAEVQTESSLPAVESGAEEVRERCKKLGIGLLNKNGCIGTYRVISQQLRTQDVCELFRRTLYSRRSDDCDDGTRSSAKTEPEQEKIWGSQNCFRSMRDSGLGWCKCEESGSASSSPPVFVDHIVSTQQWNAEVRNIQETTDPDRQFCSVEW